MISESINNHKITIEKKCKDKNVLKSCEVTRSASTKYYFDCDCGHEIFTPPFAIVQSNNWCGYCSNPPKLLCPNNADGKCESCYNKSFAAHRRASDWSKEDNNCQPWEVFKRTLKKYTFKCPNCLHKFSKGLSDISNNIWCPYCCSPPQQLCDDNCDHCYNNSFASHPKAHLWSDDNEKTARETFKHTHKHIKFDCPNCTDIYIAPLSGVARGDWCPCTKNKTEAKLFVYLMENYNQKIQKQQKFVWCANPETKRKLPFDICIEEFKLIIELDGCQHFVQVSNWNDPILTQKTDIYKMKCANNNGYSVIRILQTDVWNDKNNLLNSIKKYDTSTNIFFGDCYDNYKAININKSFPRSIPKRIVDSDNDSDIEIDNEANNTKQLKKSVVTPNIKQNTIRKSKPIIKSTSDVKRVVKYVPKLDNKPIVAKTISK
jgi:very-short-patch-repair endonuclease